MGSALYLPRWLSWRVVTDAMLHHGLTDLPFLHHPAALLGFRHRGRSVRLVSRSRLLALQPHRGRRWRCGQHRRRQQDQPRQQPRPHAATARPPSRRAGSMNSARRKANRAEKVMPTRRNGSAATRTARRSGRGSPAASTARTAGTTHRARTGSSSRSPWGGTLPPADTLAPCPTWPQRVCDETGLAAMKAGGHRPGMARRWGNVEGVIRTNRPNRGLGCRSGCIHRRTSACTNRSGHHGACR